MNYRHKPLKDERNIPRTAADIQQFLDSLKLKADPMQSSLTGVM